MFRSKKVNRTVRKSVPSIIAGDLDILGNLISDGTVDISGRIQGNVKAHTVFIRKDGRVLGDVQGDVLHIHGQVKGLVKARDVHLYATCKVEGTIMHEVLSIEDGSFVDGKFKRTDKSAIDRAKFEASGLAFASSERADITEETEEEAEAAAALSPSLNLLKNIRLITNKAE